MVINSILSIPYLLIRTKNKKDFNVEQPLVKQVYIPKAVQLKVGDVFSNLGLNDVVEPVQLNANRIHTWFMTFCKIQ